MSSTVPQELTALSWQGKEKPVLREIHGPAMFDGVEVGRLDYFSFPQFQGVRTESLIARMFDGTIMVSNEVSCRKGALT